MKKITLGFLIDNMVNFGNYQASIREGVRLQTENSGFVGKIFKARRAAWKEGLPVSKSDNDIFYGKAI
jgi:hypothetical protein